MCFCGVSSAPAILLTHIASGFPKHFEYRHSANFLRTFIFGNALHQAPFEFCTIFSDYRNIFCIFARNVEDSSVRRPSCTLVFPSSQAAFSILFMFLRWSGGIAFLECFTCVWDMSTNSQEGRQKRREEHFSTCFGTLLVESMLLNLLGRPFFFEITVIEPIVFESFVLNFFGRSFWFETCF